MNQTRNFRNLHAGLLLVFLLSTSVFAQSGIVSERERELKEAENLAQDKIRVRECLFYPVDDKGKISKAHYRSGYTEYDAQGRQVIDSLFMRDGRVLYTSFSSYEGDFLNWYTSSLHSGGKISVDSIYYSYDDQGNRHRKFVLDLENGITDTAQFLYNEHGQVTTEINTQRRFEALADTMFTFYDSEGYKLKTVSADDTTYYETDKKGQYAKRTIVGKYMKGDNIMEMSYRKGRVKQMMHYTGITELNGKQVCNYYTENGKKR